MRYWVGVASRDHVLLGVAGGFCQVCHGKQAPLARMKRGDWILYYSPKTGMNSGEKVQAFTAVGQIVDDRVYQFRMAENFEPFRRDVVFQDAPHPCPIEVAREHPEWRSYAKQLRYGHFECLARFLRAHLPLHDGERARDNPEQALGGHATVWPC